MRAAGPQSLVPDSLIRTIVATYRPVRIILFGSAARGQAGPGSDLDLLVLLDEEVSDGTVPHKLRYEARRDYHGPVDIIPYRARKFAERARASGTFAHTVSSEGVTVYERS
jgi:uncharacterized protein